MYQYDLLYRFGYDTLKHTEYIVDYYVMIKVEKRKRVCDGEGLLYFECVSNGVTTLSEQ